MNGNNQPDRRILVLGSAPHTRLVRAYTWDDLPGDLNVADYDVVILNLVPFLDEQFARQMDLDMLPSWQQFARLLFSQDSEIITIGVPGLHIGTNPYRVIPWWLPAFPVFDFESGEEIRDIEPEFAYYIEHMRRWHFYATSEFRSASRDLSHYLHLVHPQANDIRLNIRPLAQTRFQQPIAFELRYLAVHVERPDYLFHERAEPLAVNPIVESGRVIWLPPPTEISAYEAVDLILRERYGLCFEQAPPAWVETYRLPLQVPIEGEIAQYEDEMQRLTDELAAARERLQDATRFRRLLYGQGEDVLEPVVRDALQELGAQVQEPQNRGREDGRLVDPTGHNGMLEIKGRTGSLRLSDVRQLDQWVRDVIANEGWHSKGILITNTYCGDPPPRRGTPFPDNCIRTAEQFGICLMTTSQLFRALCDHQRNELDVGAFWNTIFDTSGVCPLPELDD